MPRQTVTNRFLIRDFLNAIYFNGSSLQGINIPANAVLQPGSGSFAVSLWFKPYTLGAGSKILVQQNPLDYANGYLLNQSGNDLLCYVKSGGPIITATNFFGSFLNRWMHITLVADAGTGIVKLYRNGVLFDQSAVVSWNITANVGVGIGSVPQFGTNAANGIADDIIFWKGSIPSASDVLDLYLKGILNVAPVARYKCDEGSGTTTADSIGSNTASLQNSASWSADVPLKNRVSVSGRVAVSGRVPIS